MQVCDYLLQNFDLKQALQHNQKQKQKKDHIFVRKQAFFLTKRCLKLFLLTGNNFYSRH